MTVYRLKSDYRYQSLVPEDDVRIVDAIKRFDGTKIGSSWVPLTVEINDDDPTDWTGSDFPLFLSHIPVFSRRAVEHLDTLLNPHGEIVSLNCDRGEYFAFNVTTLIDALNVNESEIVYFSSGRIMDIKKYSLYVERVQSAPIFKLPEVPLMDVFVTDSFVTLVEQSQLSGFLFEPLLFGATDPTIISNVIM